MHERSLAQALLSQVEAHARAHGGSRVTEVRIQVGPLSGVEPLLLIGALEEGSRGRISDSALFTLAEIPLTARCLDCGREFEVRRFRFHCPGCRSAQTQLLQGDAVILENIVIIDEPVTIDSVTA